MGRDDENGGAAPPPSKRDRRKSISESEPDPDSDTDDERSSRKSHRSSSRRSSSKDSKRPKTLTSPSSKRRRSRDSSTDSYTSSSDYDSESDDSDSRRRRRKERKRKDEKRRREKEKEKKRRREKEKEKEKKRKRKDKDKKKEKASKGAVTNSWGKYGIIKETDMWNKRPEFTAWLGEVKKVNLESLPNWEEKQLFKDFMEDHNTATFPSKKYYNLDAYYQRQIVKDMKKGVSMGQPSERTVFNDEEIRRLEMQQVRERQREQEVEALKRSMQSGMAQAMKEQAQLREEMAYQYKLGNFEAAAAIQRRLDPDLPT